MTSVADTVVFIPEQACVLTVPVHSLPSSITKKMWACPVQSDRPAVFISPVELREKGTTQEPSPLTPGQFFLPVVTSNHRAFRILRDFLHSRENSLQRPGENSLQGPGENSLQGPGENSLQRPGENSLQRPGENSLQGPGENSLQGPGENSLQDPGENSRACSAFSKRKNAIILFDTKIFFIVREAKAPDWLLEKPSPASPEREAPPPNSQSKTDDDIADRKRSKDGADAAEDHGKCVLEEREPDAMMDGVNTPTKDVSTNTPRAGNHLTKLKEEVEEESSHNAAGLTSEERRDNETRSAAETHTGNEKSSSDNEHKIKMSEEKSSVVKPTCCKRLLFTSGQSSSGTDANERQDKRKVKGQICDSASVSAAEIVDVNADDRDSQNNTEDGNKDMENTKRSREGQRSHKESAVEIIDISDDEDHIPVTSSGDENTVGTNASQVEKLLERCEIIKRRISDCVKLQVSALERKNASHDVTMETGADHNELIIVDDLNQNPSSSKHHGNRTKSKREGCESAVQILDLDDDQVLLKSLKNSNRDAAKTSKSPSEAEQRACPSEAEQRACPSEAEQRACPSEAEQRACPREAEQRACPSEAEQRACPSEAEQRACPSEAEQRAWPSEAEQRACPSEAEQRACPSVPGESVVKILYLSDDDDEVIITDREFRNSHGPQISDKANGCKRRISGGTTEDTDSDVATKRCKPDENAELFQCKRSESAVDTRSQVKNHTGDVEIIEVDDDDDDDDDDVKIFERDGEITELHTESQTTLEIIKSCKRDVSDSHRSDGLKLGVESDVEDQRINAEDASDEHFKSDRVLSPEAGKPGERFKDEDEDLINKKLSPGADVNEAKALYSRSVVQLMRVQDHDQDLSGDDAESNHDISKTLAAEGPVSKVQSSDQYKNVQTATARVIAVKPKVTDDVWVSSNVSDILSAAEDPACEGPQVADVLDSSALFEHSEFGEEKSEATNQSSRDEGAGVWLRPASPHWITDYVMLRRQENISCTREKLRRMEEKLNTLRNSQH